jgi:ArsR family transcriptional regulator, arsenate/arsenite/antimonite-responsive transcriptional repressor / arsenate reductase (thioredoxin)
MDSVIERAAVHAALGEPVRLAIVEDLAVSDRSPKELAARFSVPSNLLAHHLDVLEGVGLIERFTSAGDRRRRYVRLVRAPARPGSVSPRRGPPARWCSCAVTTRRVRSWRRRCGAARTGGVATSAGTHPADRVHPEAVAAGSRAGLDLGRAKPRMFGAAGHGRARRDGVRPGARRTRPGAGMVALVAARPGPRTAAPPPSTT